MLGPELKKPLKRLAARFFQLSLPPLLLLPLLLPLGREQLEGAGGSCPGMLASPRNSDMFLRRRPGAWSGSGRQGQTPTAPPHGGFPGPPPAWEAGGSLHTPAPGDAASPETYTCSGGRKVQTDAAGSPSRLPPQPAA